MNTFRAGAAWVDITPKLGHDLAGWIDVRPATRQASPILARAIAMTTAQSQVLIITCDLLEIGIDLLKRIQDSIHKVSNFPPQHIFVLPSHNHYGPSVSGNYAGDAIQTSQELAYIEKLIDGLSTAARTALNYLKPAHLGVGYSEEKTNCHNSRFWRKDGTINWVGDRASHFARESGPVDPQVGALRISDDQDNTIATLYNYACHANAAEPDGFTTISWDWPGYASQAIEQVLGGTALFLLGACGNIHPIREGMADEMGKKIAGAVIQAARGIEFIDPASLEIRKQELTLPARDFSSFGPGQIEAICSQLWDEETRTKVQNIFQYVLEDLKSKNIHTLTGQIRTISFGNLAMVFIPGEFFTEFGLEIKKHSPFKHTFVIESLSESLGYVPTRLAYQEGGYQPAVGTRVAPGGGELIMEKSLALLEDMKH